MTLPFAIRDGVDTDLAFVKNSWRGTFHTGGHGAQGCDRGHYHDEMTRVFDRVFKKASVVVACNPKDQDTLIGFAVHTGPELHFVYVRMDFRKAGVARALLEGLPIRQYTFSTHIGNERLRPQQRGWIFTPRWTL